MRRKKSKKDSGEATRENVKKEMAKPRMAKSARMAALNLDAKRIPEPRPRTTLPGKVDKIIPSPYPTLPE
jgi:hypothetical protein